MNKYQKGLTPEEAALIAVNLESYRTLDNAEKHIDDDLCLGHSTCVTSEQLNEAMDILKALKEETWLAHEYEQNSSSQSSCLEIYRPMYNQKFNGMFDPEYTQLTKDSLAKWFEELGEISISKKFKVPKKVVAINIFKQSYTAEHAALIAVGLNAYSSIDSAIESSNYQSELVAIAHDEVERGGDYTDFEVDPLLEDESISNALNLKEVLINEIKLASKDLASYFSVTITSDNGTSIPMKNKSTEIVIDPKKNINNKDFDSILITKDSVAAWLWKSGYTRYAVNVLPNIEQFIEDQDLKSSKKWQQLINQSQPIDKNENAEKRIRTPESSLIDSLGIMSWLLSKKINTFKRGDKPNFKQIKEAVERVIIELGLNENEENKTMVSNLNRDIKTAFVQLESRFHLK